MYNDTLRKTFTNVHFFGGVGKDNLLVMYIFGERPGSKLELLSFIFPQYLNFMIYCISLKKKSREDFPGGPVGRTMRFQCRGPGFDPWSGN